MACLTRRSLTDSLFSNMGDLALYHSSYRDNPLRETVRNVQVIGIEPLPDDWNPEGVLEYKVDIDVKYKLPFTLPEQVQGQPHNWLTLCVDTTDALLTVGIKPFGQLTDSINRGSSSYNLSKGSEWRNRKPSPG